MEFNYLEENLSNANLISSQDIDSYGYEFGKSFKFDAVVRTSLSEKFSIDLALSQKEQEQGSFEACSSLVKMKTQSLALKSSWQASKSWTYYVSGSYACSNDHYLDHFAYTLTPGCGFIYRFQDSLRIDFDFSYAKTRQAVETERYAYSLRSKYSLSSFVDVLLRIDQEKNNYPEYYLTDITGNVQINL
jgi:hypothetical protein